MDRTNWKEVLSSPGPCLSTADLEMYVDASAAPARLAAIQEHLAECSTCRTELALYQEFATGTARPGEKEPVDWIETRLARNIPQATAERKSPWWQPIAALFTPKVAAVAFASVLLVTVGLYLRQGSEPELNTATPPDANYRSTRLEAVAPVGDVTTAPAEFVWKPAPQAAKYRVRILEVDQNVLLSTETGSASLNVAPNLQSRFTPGKTVLWEVTALDASGRTIAQSGIQQFRVVRVAP